MRPRSARLGTALHRRTSSAPDDANGHEVVSRPSATTPAPDRLLVMLLDRLVLDLQRAVAALDSGDRQGAHTHLTHAEDIVMELRSSARTEGWAGGLEVAGIYDWLHTELTRAAAVQDCAIARGCLGVATQVADALGRAEAGHLPAAAAAS